MVEIVQRFFSRVRKFDVALRVVIVRATNPANASNDIDWQVRLTGTKKDSPYKLGASDESNVTPAGESQGEYRPRSGGDQ